VSGACQHVGGRAAERRGWFGQRLRGGFLEARNIRPKSEREQGLSGALIEAQRLRIVAQRFAGLARQLVHRREEPRVVSEGRAADRDAGQRFVRLSELRPRLAGQSRRARMVREDALHSLDAGAQLFGAAECPGAHHDGFMIVQIHRIEVAGA
jgi:hypothetical protein